MEIAVIGTGIFGGGAAGVEIAQYAEWIVLNNDCKRDVVDNVINIFKATPYFCGGAILGVVVTVGAYVLIKNYYDKRKK